MDDIQITKPDTIKYTDYMYFSPEEATAWVYDVVKYENESKHKDYILFSEYAHIVNGFKKYLDRNGIKLLSDHPLLNEKDICFYQFIEKIWGVESNLNNMNGDTAYTIPELLITKIPDEFYYDYFKSLYSKQKVTIKVGDYLLVKLLDFDYENIGRVYTYQELYTAGEEPKFYLAINDEDEQAKYVQQFVKEYVMSDDKDKIVWEVFDDRDNTCVALVYLKHDKGNKSARMNVTINTGLSDTNFAQVVRTVKNLCFDKLGVNIVYSENYNMGYEYSSLNTMYHFAGFKAKYEIDHSTFEAEPESYPALDEIYSQNKDSINNTFTE